MNYNWQSAATPQGRERLKELGQKEVVAKITRHGIGHIEEIQADVVLKRWEGESVEFLDPSPQPQQPDDAPEGYHVVTFAKDQQPGENGLTSCPTCGCAGYRAEKDAEIEAEKANHQGTKDALKRARKSKRELHEIGLKQQSEIKRLKAEIEQLKSWNQ